MIREEQMRKKMLEKRDSGDKSKGQIWSSSDPVDVIERKTGKILTASMVGLAPTQKNLHRWLEENPTYEVLRDHLHHK